MSNAPLTLLPTGNTALAGAITAGPAALQRFVDSGELEDLADVIPYIDDDDDFDEYDDYDDNMDLETMSDIELPAPLPSSVFARKAAQKKQQQQQQQHPPYQRRSRFSDREDTKADPEANAARNSRDTPSIR
jgi:hypothetical protein